MVRDLYTSIGATGKIAVTDEASVYLKTPQKVEKIHVKEGDRVYRGQLLVTYDISSEIKSLEQKRRIAYINQLNAELGAQSIALPAAGNELLSYTSEVNDALKNIRDSENAIESIRIRISQQQIRVDDAQKLEEKNNELFEQGFLTKDEYDLSVSANKNATESLNDLALSLESEEQNLAYRRIQHSNAEQKLANVKSSLGDMASRLRYEQQLNTAELSKIEIEQIDDEMENLIAESLSPVNGIIISIGVSEGATATRGSPVAKISDLSTLVVKADISQFDAPRLKNGQRADVYVSGLPDKMYGGVIDKIAAASIEKESGSEKEVIVPVEIKLSSADYLIKTGYSVDVDIIDDGREGALSVPSQAIFNDGGKQFVYMLLPPEEGDIASDGSDVDDSVADGGGGFQGFINRFAAAASKLFDGYIDVKNLDGALEYIQTVFGRTLDRLDGLFPQAESAELAPVRVFVTTGFYGDNGVEILSGAEPGDMVVLNP